MKHSWAYEEAWMETVAGKFCGGFSRCRNCNLMRFSRAGHPPQHYYVHSDVLESEQGSTKIRPGAACVMPTAGSCDARKSEFAERNPVRQIDGVRFRISGGAK